MADASGISWCDATWNPIVGCTRVSAGCGTGTAGGCYAERMAHRLASNPKTPIYHGLTVSGRTGPRWSGVVRLDESKLHLPLRWHKPRRIFVNSMSDLFHESVPDEWIDRIFAVMSLCPQHTFIVLTKRAGRMRDYLVRRDDDFSPWINAAARLLDSMGRVSFRVHAHFNDEQEGPSSPLPNVHLGVSAEDQPTWDERVDLLAQTPAAVRIVSLEPMLGPVNTMNHRECDQCGNTVYALYSGDPHCPQNPQPAWEGFQCPLHWWPASGCDGKLISKIDQIIVGGESGPGARPCDVEWILSVVRQCREAGVACFVKQLGAHPIQSAAPLPEPQSADSIMRHGEYDPDPFEWKLRNRKGADMSEWPEDLRVREFPEVRA